MEAKVNFAIVGAFVLVLSAALVAGVLWLSSGQSYRKGYETYIVYMKESVSGLSVDAPVRYRGVDVGAVRRIALARNDVEQVQLTLAIERGTPVKQDTIAVLRTQGLTGIAHVELTGGSRASAPLVARPDEEYPVIRTGPSLMVRLDAAVTTLLANLNRSSESVNATLDDGNRAALKDVLANLKALSQTLAAHSGAIDSSLVSGTRTMENVARVTAELPRLIERVHRSADAFDRMADEGARAGASATGTLESARTETREVSAALRQFAAETLPEVQALLGELRELTASLRRAGEQIERNPAVLIHGRSPSKPGPGE